MKIDVTLVDNTELTFNITKDTFVIGRSPQCDVVIPHEGMSRRHCQISLKDGDLYIEDFGSVNGVHIDGKKIPPNTPTKFQVFLNVTFGSVQSLKIDLEDGQVKAPMPGSIAAVTSTAHKTSPKIIRPSAVNEKADKTGSVKRPDRHDLTATRKIDFPRKKPVKKLDPLVVILSLGILGAGIYFFMQEQSEPTEPVIDNRPYYEKKVNK